MKSARVNWEWTLKGLDGEQDGLDTEVTTRRTIEPSHYQLCSRLPPLTVIRRDAEEEVKSSYTKACINAALSSELERPQISEISEEETRRSRSDSKSDRLNTGNTVKQPPPAINSTATTPRRKVAHWELLRAIEKKDLQLIFETRDSQFGLLVSAQAGSTPLNYCLRIGKSHRDIAVLLVGALSRWVNNLPDTPPDQETKVLLRQVRVSLKLAIDFSLSANQTELISSYLQVIVMSEGETWIRKSAQDVGLALRAGRRGRPVATAFAAIQAFATRELRQLNKTASVASVEDYVCNACADLILTALWANIAEVVGGVSLPSYQFARDDRLFKTFTDRLESAMRAQNYAKVNKASRDQAKVVCEVLATRAISHRAKVDTLKERLDEEQLV